MTEQDFIDNAMKLDNETRKPIVEDDGNASEQDEALNDIPQDEE